MRRFALALTVTSLVLALAALARAQRPGAEATQELAIVGTEVVRIDDVWSVGAAGRTSRVTASAFGTELVLHDGRSVRMATAGRADSLAVVVFHGGDEPFARVLVSRLEGDHLAAPVSVELDRSLARALSPELRPAVAVIAPTTDGFVVVLQEQRPDPTLPVQTTLTRLDASGVIVEATHAVGLPWQLAAIAESTTGYELVVVYGGHGSADHPVARACVVSLGATGAPTEHPWWASGEDAMAEVHVVVVGGTIVVGWRGGDGVSVFQTVWSARGAWARPPSSITTLGHVAADAPYTIVVRDGAATIVTR